MPVSHLSEATVENLVTIARLRMPPEVHIAVAYLLLMLAVAFVFRLPIILPNSDRAAFVGVHFIYPLIGVGLLGILTLFVGNTRVAIRFLVAMPSYALVLFAHFNFKLWIPHLNPQLFDSVYMSIDRHLQVLVDFCDFTRVQVFGFIPFEANFYMLGFMLLFYVSFAWFAVNSPGSFGRLTLAVILLQVLGSLAYLVAPAIGPFIYQDGVNPIITEGQAGMLEFYRASVAEGPAFLVQNGPQWFTAGLAAMPSLHVAGAFLFLLFAWREARVLVPVFLFAFAFIVVTSVASRWHYLIDLPVGALLAWFCYAVASRTGDRTASQPAMQGAAPGSVIQM